jgi:hypothetical protein
MVTLIANMRGQNNHFGRVSPWAAVEKAIEDKN